MVLKRIWRGSSQTSEEVATVILNTLEMEEPPIRTRTSDWSEAFTELKTQADPTGKEQQRRVVKLLENINIKAVVSHLNTDLLLLFNLFNQVIFSHTIKRF